MAQVQEIAWHKSRKFGNVMDQRNLKVSDLARESGVPAKTIYHWLAGQTPRKITHVCSVARVLDFTLEQLFFGIRSSELEQPKMLPGYRPPIFTSKEQEVTLRIQISVYPGANHSEFKVSKDET